MCPSFRREHRSHESDRVRRAEKDRPARRRARARAEGGRGAGAVQLRGAVRHEHGAVPGRRALGESQHRCARRAGWGTRTSARSSSRGPPVGSRARSCWPIPTTTTASPSTSARSRRGWPACRRIRPTWRAMVVAQPLATVLRALVRTGPVINQRCAVVGPRADGPDLHAPPGPHGRQPGDRHRPRRLAAAVGQAFRRDRRGRRLAAKTWSRRSAS